MDKKNKEITRNLLSLGKTFCLLGMLTIIYLIYKDSGTQGILFVDSLQDFNKSTVLNIFYSFLWFMMGYFWLMQDIYKFNFEFKHLLIANFIMIVELFILIGVYYFLDIAIMPGIILMIFPTVYLYLVRIIDKTGKYQEDFTGREHLILPERKKAD